MRASSHWRRGLLFGAVCGAFGGVAWAVIILLQGEASDLPLAVGVTALYWAVLGFILGALGPAATFGRAQQPQVAAQPLWRKVVAMAGDFLYRTVVGLLVGSLVASLIELTGFGLTYAVYGDVVVPLGEPKALVCLNAFLAAITASCVGGLVGGWLCPTDGRRTAVRGSIFAGALGFLSGAVAAVVLNLAAVAYGALVAGMVAGVVGPVLARRLELSRKPAEK